MTDIDLDIPQSQPAKGLLVVAHLPAVPVVLASADAMAAVERLEASAASVARVTDDATAQAAWTALGDATKMAKQLDKARLETSAPFRELVDRINAAAKGVSERIDKAKLVIQSGIKAHEAAVETKRREEEDRRRREAEELERKRQAEERKLAAEKAEADRLAREAEERAKAKGVEIVDVDVDDALDIEDVPSETEQRIAEIQAQQQALAKPVAPAIVKPAGAQMRVTLKPLVVDVARIPESLLKPREADLERIRGLYCTKWKDGDLIPTVAGLKFEVVRTPIMR